MEKTRLLVRLVAFAWFRYVIIFGFALDFGSRLNAEPPPTKASVAQSEEIKGWPAEVRAIEYTSDADGTNQPALFYDPGGDAPKPLLVALHSWSGDYRQANPAYAQWCIAKGWVLIHPDFRGVNQRPEACGSELVVKDILSAVAFAKRTCKIDPSRIYLIGASGGGYASLLLAGRAPELWAGVSAWCPIYDLKAWHAETKTRKLRYAEMLEAVCGGPPGSSEIVDEEYRRRSAKAFLAQAAGKVNLAINTGITDGHHGSVPVGHTLRAFNAVADESDRLSDAAIASFESSPELAAPWRQSIKDPTFGKKRPLFRRVSNSAQVTIFQGGHEIVFPAGLAWLEQQRKGKPPVWKFDPPAPIELTEQP
jgi:pimeloyl-ACP methyl ester carboxylesterase